MIAIAKGCLIPVESEGLGYRTTFAVGNTLEPRLYQTVWLGGYYQPAEVVILEELL